MAISKRISELDPLVLSENDDLMAIVNGTKTYKHTKFNFLQRVLITDESQLPAVDVNGYHPLENKVYIFAYLVNLVAPILFNTDSACFGDSFTTTDIQYSGTLPFFKAEEGGTINAKDMKITHPNSDLIDYNSTTGTCIMQSVVSIGKSGGSIVESYVNIFEFCQFVYTVEGFDFSGVNIYDIVAFRNSQIRFLSGTGTQINLNSTVSNTLSIVHNKFNIGVGRKGIVGLANSGNVIDIAFLTANEFNGGGGTYLTNITPSDLKWVSLSNRNVRDSDTFAGASFIDNATNTVITSGVPTPILGTFIESAISSRATCDSAGIITIHNLEPVHKTFLVSISFSKTGGATRTLTFYLYQNGAAIPNTKINRVVSAATGNVTLVVPADLAQNDTFQLFVDSDQNVTITAEDLSIATS